MSGLEAEEQMTPTTTKILDDSPVSEVQPQNGFRTPLDAPIRAVAKRIGRSNPTKVKELERFFRFALVGISGAVIDIGLVYTLQATVLPPVNRINVMIVTIIAFFTAVVSNFTWTRLWVYPDSRSRSMRRQLVMFAFISTVGGVGRTIWITLSHNFIGQLALPLALPFIRILRPWYEPGPYAAGKLGTLISLLIAMVVVMLWNFFANRYWTYNDVE
jgi:putative flippase GtrA